MARGTAADGLDDSPAVIPTLEGKVNGVNVGPVQIQVVTADGEGRGGGLHLSASKKGPGNHKGAGDAIDGVSKGAWVVPVPEADNFAADAASTNADSEDEKDGEGENLDQGQPELDLSVSQDAKIGQAQENHPEDEDPSPLRHNVCPVTHDEGERVVLVSQNLWPFSNPT